MSSLENTKDATNKFFNKVEGEYILDLQGVETYCKVSSDRYDEIYNKPTISYHLSFENIKLKDLGDNDNHTYEPMKICPTSGVKMVNFQRLPEYTLPISKTGYKSHFSGFIDMESIKHKNTDDIVVEISKWIMIDAGHNRKKYFCTKRFADVPIVSIIKRI